MTRKTVEATHPHRVVMIGYADAQILDITGPLEVFSRTARWLRDEEHTQDLSYTVELVGLQAGPFATSSGLRMVAERAYSEVDIDAIDTLLVTGGIGWRAASEDAALAAWLRKAACSVPRMGSICTGALLLARTGLLAGHRATTHWAYCDELSKAIGTDLVSADAIFVKDGLYTSAGVTAGMDMALAMVEEDWGQAAALAVARELVLFLKRPGGQAQFSAELQAQRADSDRLQALQLWMVDHLDGDLSVQALAEHVAMSPRTFARRFAREIGVPPGRYVEKLRIDAARRKLEATHLPLDAISHRVGFGSPETLRRAFLRNVGVTPGAYRKRFAVA